jgi:hypothetical protein
MKKKGSITSEGDGVTVQKSLNKVAINQRIRKTRIERIRTVIIMSWKQQIKTKGSFELENFEFWILGSFSSPCDHTLRPG